MQKYKYIIEIVKLIYSYINVTTNSLNKRALKSDKKN